MTLGAVALGAALLVATGCGRAEARRGAESGSPDSTGAPRAALSADSLTSARQDSINRSQPGYIVDSILPLDEELRRFRGGLTSVPTRLTGGADSRDALMETFVRAVEARDSVALVRLVLTRGEFAYLVYPGSPYTRPPYRQAPWLVWSQIQTGSSAGFTRLLRRFGGRRLAYAGYACDPTPEEMESNRLWKNCRLRLTNETGALEPLRLFGVVIERQGRFKIVGYENDL